MRGEIAQQPLRKRSSMFSFLLPIFEILRLIFGPSSPCPRWRTSLLLFEETDLRMYAKRTKIVRRKQALGAPEPENPQS